MDQKQLLALESLYGAVGDPVAWPVAALCDGADLDSRHRELASGLHARLRVMAARLEASTLLLNQLPHPVLVVDDALRVLIVQHRAQSILDRKDGLSLEGGTLVSSRHDATVTLKGGVDAALRENTRISLSIRRARASSDLAILIAPLLRTVAPWDFPPAAMIMIADPEQELSVNEPALRQLYGLTRAEVRVASLLLAGKTLDEAADVLCVSLNTVRTHLQRIFAKTDTSRQAHLIRTLLLGPAGIP